MGCDEVVRTVRHDMAKLQWEAVARMLLYGLRVHYFPLRLSPVFLISVLLGEDNVSNDMLLTSFKAYISSEERDNITSMLDHYTEEGEELLLETLGCYKCYRKPSPQCLMEILLELAHQELIQKPRYIANCITTVFKGRLHPFKSIVVYYNFISKGQCQTGKLLNYLKQKINCQIPNNRCTVIWFDL